MGDEPIVFGRNEDLNYVFSKDNLRMVKWQNISKKHFYIKRNPENGDVQLQDLSSNGTFVNGVKVGKNRSYPLTHLSTIGFGLPNLKFFTFINNIDKNCEEERMPVDFKEKYALENVMLGEGGFGVVKKCFLKVDPTKKFAVKIIKKCLSLSAKKYDFSYEADILFTVEHKNIVKVVDCFENEHFLFMVMELVCGGELFHYVKSKGPVEEGKTARFFKQLLEGVSHLHEKGITHRDLKPENILLDHKDFPTCLKITDFGMSRFVSENSLMETMQVGTKLYVSPEMIDPNIKGYTKKVDAWALGCILFIMLGGYPPFVQEEECSNIERDILQGNYTFGEERWGNVSDTAKDLVKKLLTVKVDERSSVAEALQHPFMNREDTSYSQDSDGFAVPPAKKARSR